MQEKGISTVNELEFNAYVGLEVAMSLVQLNGIVDYWIKSMFSGHPDFQATISRDRFTQIWSNLCFKNSVAEDAHVNSMDPLHSAWWVIKDVQAKFAEVAIPLGCSALDEATCRCKGRNHAVSYIPSKPDRFGIQLYAVVGWDSTYIHSIWDNGRGNKEPNTPAQCYVHVHKDLVQTLAQKFLDPFEVDKTSASAL